MPYKCCVCKSNYSTSIKIEGTVSVYRFPDNKVDREQWMSVVPRDDIREIFQKYEDAKERGEKKKKPMFVVCRKHWPESMGTFNYRGKIRPIDPPSIFSKVSSSTTSTPQNSRPTRRALSSVRSVLPDELGLFLEQDVLDFDKIGDVCTNPDVIAYS